MIIFFKTENQRITAVRKIYQRGVVTPMLNIEQLWKDYIAYESSINPMIAEKMQQVCNYLQLKLAQYKMHFVFLRSEAEIT